MLAEEKAMSRLEKETLVEVLYKNKMYSEALGVAQRNNLNVPRNFQNEIRNKPGLKPIPNKVLQIDDFLPTEVYLENAKKETYLTMHDLGFKYEDVIFLNKVDKTFEHVTSRLLNAKTVGVDAEFSSDLIGYAPSTIAILQLATEDLAVIIDFIALRNDDSLYDFCVKFFGSSDIEKVGHTFTSDIKCLKTTFQDKPMDFANIINIDQAFKDGNQNWVWLRLLKRSTKRIFKIQPAEQLG